MKRYEYILLVDDDMDDLDLLEQAIESFDASIKCEKAANGRQGIEKLLSGKPDLIISDVNMPVMDGILFLQCLRGELSIPIPVIMISTNAMEAHQALTLGANHFFPKWNSLSELRLRLNQALSIDFCL